METSRKLPGIAKTVYFVHFLSLYYKVYLVATAKKAEPSPLITRVYQISSFGKGMLSESNKNLTKSVKYDFMMTSLTASYASNSPD